MVGKPKYPKLLNIFCIEGRKINFFCENSGLTVLFPFIKRRWC